MKKLSRPDAQSQARRLQASPMLAPQSDDGRKEIVDCLLRNCIDVEHASRTMTHVLDNCTDPRNLTAELKRAASETLQMPQAVPPGCDVCRLDPDPMTGAERWMAHVPGDRNGYSCAVRCRCERGQWLSRRDRERDVPQQAPRVVQGMLSAGKELKEMASMSPAELTHRIDQKDRIRMAAGEAE